MNPEDEIMAREQDKVNRALLKENDKLRQDAANYRQHWQDEVARHFAAQESLIELRQELAAKDAACAAKDAEITHLESERDRLTAQLLRESNFGVDQRTEIEQRARLLEESRTALMKYLSAGHKDARMDASTCAKKVVTKIGNKLEDNQ